MSVSTAATAALDGERFNVLQARASAVYNTPEYDAKALQYWKAARDFATTVKTLEQNHPGQFEDTNLYLVNPSTMYPVQGRIVFYTQTIDGQTSASKALSDRDKLLAQEAKLVTLATQHDKNGAKVGPRVVPYARVIAYEKAAKYWEQAAQVCTVISAKAAQHPNLPIDTGLVNAHSRATLYTHNAQRSAAAAQAIANGSVNSQGQPVDPISGVVLGPETTADDSALAGVGEIIITTLVATVVGVMIGRWFE